MDMQALLRAAAACGATIVVIKNSSVVISGKAEIVDVDVENEKSPGLPTGDEDEKAAM